MTFSTIILVPFNVTHTEGELTFDPSEFVYDVPPVIGSGSLVDDSDASGVALGGYNLDGVQHIERITADFTTPTDVTPLAVLIQIRAKNSAGILADPPTSDRLLFQSLQATADGAILDTQALGNLPAENWPIGPLTTPEVSEPTTFTWYWDHHPDIGNPTDSGYWYELALNPAALAALVGDGLRVTLGWWVYTDPDEVGGPTRRSWVDVYEIRLVVAVVASGRRYRRPLRQFPRSDGLGSSSAPRVDANRSIQRSLRQGPGAYL